MIDTLLYSLLTILVFGSMLHPILTKMDVKNKPSLDVDNPRQKKNYCNYLKDKLQKFESLYFSPIFIKDAKRIEERNEEQKENAEFIETWVVVDDPYVIRNE